MTGISVALLILHRRLTKSAGANCVRAVKLQSEPIQQRARVQLNR